MPSLTLSPTPGGKREKEALAFRNQGRARWVRLRSPLHHPAQSQGLQDAPRSQASLQTVFPTV